MSSCHQTPLATLAVHHPPPCLQSRSGTHADALLSLHDGAPRPSVSPSCNPNSTPASRVSGSHAPLPRALATGQQSSAHHFGRAKILTLNSALGHFLGWLRHCYLASSKKELENGTATRAVVLFLPSNHHESPSSGKIMQSSKTSILTSSNNSVVQHFLVCNHKRTSEFRRPPQMLHKRSRAATILDKFRNRQRRKKKEEQGDRHSEREITGGGSRW